MLRHPAIGQQRRVFDGVVPGIAARSGQRTGINAPVGELAHLAGNALPLGFGLLQPLAMGQHDGRQGSDHQQRRGQLEGEHVVAEHDLGQGRHILAVRWEASVLDHRIAHRQHQQDRESEDQQAR